MNPFTRRANAPPPSYQDSVDPPKYSAGAAGAAGAAGVAGTPGASSASGAAPSSASRDVQGRNGDSDQYAFLTSFDTVFLIDNSGSMAGSSWAQCREALEAITPICTAHDADGIDIHFLNRTLDNFKPGAAVEMNYYKGVTTAAAVHSIFESSKPRGQTPTGQRLHAIIEPYLKRITNAPSGTFIKPMNIIVITDGVPCDDVESTLISAAKKLDEMNADPWQLGVQFVQVGHEPSAKEHLETLDDELQAMGRGCRDIVDTVPCNTGEELSSDTILKVVLGAVNKRLDRRRASTSARR